MTTKLSTLITLAIGLSVTRFLYAAAPDLSASTSRVVNYHETDIVRISTAMRFTTLIELPKEESIIEATCGDKDNWAVNWTGNLAYIKPAQQGSSTNINLITASGNVYSFLASEQSKVDGAKADLKVFVNPADSSAIVAMKDKPRFVSADSVEAYKKATEQAQHQLEAERIAQQKEFEREKTELKASYPATIRHDYKFNAGGGAGKPFHVTAIYHDDRFTYIEATPQETPAVYEVKDGKPSLIQYDFDAKTNRYIIPKILDQGYLRIGKSELRFEREVS